MPAKHSQRRTRFIRVAFFSLAFALVLAASFLLSKTYAGKASVSVANLASSETQSARKTEISETRQKKLQAALLNLPLSFEAGPGTNEFRTRGHGYSLLLTATGLHFSPGADPRAIKFRFDRKATVETSSEGGLILKAASHQIREQKPIVYQDIAGERKIVEGRYVLKAGQAGFEIGPYDRTKPLII